MLNNSKYSRNTAFFVAEWKPQFAKQIKPSINGLILPLILGFFISIERRISVSYINVKLKKRRYINVKTKKTEIIS